MRVGADGGGGGGDDDGMGNVHKIITMGAEKHNKISTQKWANSIWAYQHN